MDVDLDPGERGPALDAPLHDARREAPARLAARGARTAAHGFDTASPWRASQSKRPRQLESTRASERGELPREWSVATKRRISRSSSASSARPSASESSKRPSRE